MNKKTGVFGSAFNPPHMGHADVVDQALIHFDRVILVPSFAHAFGKVMAPYPMRLEMTHVLVSENNWGKRVEVSNIEASIAANKPLSEPIYTFDTLTMLAAEDPLRDLSVIIGPDNAASDIWQKFYKAQEIDKRWGRWCAVERKQIRSSDIRNAIRAHKHIDHSLCPMSIIKTYTDYIFQPK